MFAEKLFQCGRSTPTPNIYLGSCRHRVVFIGSTLSDIKRYGFLLEEKLREFSPPPCSLAPGANVFDLPSDCLSRIAIVENFIEF
jgi:hypothetical protein